MNHPPDKPTVDSAFDRALRDALQDGAEPADGGFSLRVMAALPARAVPRPLGSGRVSRWVRWAHWTALSLAGAAIAVLFTGGGAPADAPHALATVALIGLLIAWSLPGSWARG